MPLSVDHPVAFLMPYSCTDNDRLFSIRTIIHLFCNLSKPLQLTNVVKHSVVSSTLLKLYSKTIQYRFEGILQEYENKKLRS